MKRQKHYEKHRVHRVGWLRAAVLGANDGIVSTASLMVGVAASGADWVHILFAGVAGLVAGAMSMAAGEYVSVSSQSDLEQADLEREKQELRDDPEHELMELTQIYVGRGLDEALARQVAEKMMAHNALEAHLRDELGLTETARANPLQAALASALTFAVGALFPVVLAMLAPLAYAPWVIGGGSFIALCGLGVLAANAGGSSAKVAVMRIAGWGGAAMLMTAGVGVFFPVA